MRIKIKNHTEICVEPFPHKRSYPISVSNNVLGYITLYVVSEIREYL